MLYTSFEHVDLSKYQRVFVFGCSFTKYAWSSWADIVASLMPQAEYHNFAMAGAGQMYIQTALSQASNKYKFGKQDLVLVMWSTYYRLDLYMNHPIYDRWVIAGNLYSSGEIWPEELLARWSPRGFLIRDLGIIDITHKWFSSAEFDSMGILGLNPHNHTCMLYNQEAGDSMHDRIDDVVEFYQHTLETAVPQVFYFDPSISFTPYKTEHDGVLGDDYHPTIPYILDFLHNLGLKIPPETRIRYLQEHAEFANGDPVIYCYEPNFIIP